MPRGWCQSDHELAHATPCVFVSAWLAVHAAERTQQQPSLSAATSVCTENTRRCPYTSAEVSHTQCSHTNRPHTHATGDFRPLTWLKRAVERRHSPRRAIGQRQPRPAAAACTPLHCGCPQPVIALHASAYCMSRTELTALRVCVVFFAQRVKQQGSQPMFRH